MMSLPKPLKFILLLFTFTTISFLLSTKVNAASLYLTPSSSTQNASFDVDVNLDPESDEIDAVDAVLTYDPTKLDVLEIKNGDFEQYLKKSFNRSLGKIEISALNATTPAKILTKVATISFKVTGNGTANVDFIFTPGATDDSNALEKGVESLTSVAGASYTVSTDEPSNAAGSAGTTVPENPTLESSPSGKIPETGALPDSVYSYLILSALLTAGGFTLLRKS